MSKGEQPLLAPGLFLDLSDVVARLGIRTLVETGTGPASSGMEAARRLGLHGYSCDVYEPCVERASRIYPEFDIYFGDSLGMLRDCLPKIVGPTFFWLDGHCPTDSACLPGGIFPLYDEMRLIRELKPDFAQDVFWLDDVAMIVDPANPVASSWDVYLGGPDARWYGEKDHTWEEYLGVFAATHDYWLDDYNGVLKLTPR